MHRLGIAFVFIFCLNLPNGMAQMHDLYPFSDYKAPIQFSAYQWNCHTFGNLNIYYYGNGNEMASMVAWYTKQQLAKLGNELGFTYQGLLHVLVFRNPSDFISSNLGSAAPQNQALGWNHQVAIDRIVVVNTGSLNDCQRQIRREVAKLLIYNSINGSTFKSQLVNQTLINLPPWFIDGLADYMAGATSTDLQLRFNKLLNQEPLNFNLLSNNDWKALGFFLFQYIHQTYDNQQWRAILSLTRATQSAEDAIAIALGRSFNGLLNECIRFAKQQSQVSAAPSNLKIPEFDKWRFQHAVTLPSFSKSQNAIAMLVQKRGKYCVTVTDFEHDKQKCVLKVPILLNDIPISAEPVLMQWSPIMDNLIVVARVKGKLNLYQYDLPSDHLRVRSFDYFEVVNGFNVSPDGSMLVVSAVKDGYTDLFMVTLAGMHIQRLTRDVFDDHDPLFLGSNQLVFCSNRNTTEVFPSFVEVTKDLRPEFDLFLLPLPSPKPAKQAVQLTFTASKSEACVGRFNDTAFSFLTKSNGLAEQCFGIVDSTVISFDTLAHYQKFLRAYTTADPPSLIADQCYLSASNAFINQVGTGLFVYVPLAQPLSMSPYKTDDEPTLFERSHEPDSLPSHQAFAGFSKYELSQEALKKTGFLGFNNPDTLQAKPKDVTKFRLKGLIPYKPEFFIRRISSSIDFSAYNFNYQQINNPQQPSLKVPGFNVHTQAGCADLTEDHHIDLALRLSADLVNNEYVMRYRNLKYRLDQAFTFYYHTFQQAVPEGLVSLRDYHLGGMARWPFSEHLSLSGKYSLNYALTNYKAVDEFNLRKPTQTTWRPTIGLILENNHQHQIFLNLRKGLAYRIFAEGFYASHAKHMVYSVGCDFRYYARLGKSVFAAVRTAAGTSGAAGKLLFVLGGMYNQLGADYENQVPIGLNASYEYQTHTTGLRGYKVGVRQGSSYVLMSGELRLPVFKMLFKNPLRSVFLSDFQVVGFADAGTAWAGGSPFSDENELYVRYINNGPIAVKTYEQHQPIVASYGLGLRGLVLGYFMKIDYAWPLFDGKTHQAVIQVAMGLDF